MCSGKLSQLVKAGEQPTMRAAVKAIEQESGGRMSANCGGRELDDDGDWAKNAESLSRHRPKQLRWQRRAVAEKLREVFTRRRI